MFKRKVQNIGDLLKQYLRDEGLETPLMHRRILDSWEIVVGKTVASYSEDKFIKNQTLFVKITNPALRQNLSMMRTQLVKRLNETVGGFIISDIRLY